MSVIGRPPVLVDPGEQSGRLTVVGHARHRGYRMVVCRCECGNRATVRASHFARGRVRSCGCLFTNRSHGLHDHPLYQTWKAMHKRCSSPHAKDYPNYGARGIYVDPRWDDPAAFIADMGDRPEGTTLDRIDNDGPYSPENCRWATPKQQCENQRLRGQ